jgi:hypothetical protein
MAVVVSNRQRPEEAWINAIAFCHDRNYARDHLSFYPTYSPDDHSNVKQHFLKKNVRGIASRLDQLRQARNRCDYDDAVANIAGELSRALALAERVIAELSP